MKLFTVHILPKTLSIGADIGEIIKGTSGQHFHD